MRAVKVRYVDTASGAVRVRVFDAQSFATWLHLHAHDPVVASVKYTSAQRAEVKRQWADAAKALRVTPELLAEKRTWREGLAFFLGEMFEAFLAIDPVAIVRWGLQTQGAMFLLRCLPDLVSRWNADLVDALVGVDNHAAWLRLFFLSFILMVCASLAVVLAWYILIHFYFLPSRLVAHYRRIFDNMGPAIRSIEIVSAAALVCMFSYACSWVSVWANQARDQRHFLHMDAVESLWSVFVPVPEFWELLRTIDGLMASGLFIVPLLY